MSEGGAKKKEDADDDDEDDDAVGSLLSNQYKFCSTLPLPHHLTDIQLTITGKPSCS